MERDAISVRVDEAILELIPGFLSNRRADVDTVQTALATGDWERVRLIAHSMKGAGGGYGFERITEIGGAMETAAVSRDAEVVGERLRELADYLERVEVVPDTDP